MKKINNVVKSPIAPRATNAIWINTEDNTINVFDEHQGWIQVSGGAQYVKLSILTQDEYDALATKDASTLYIISDAQ